ncbi:hypothetical protein ACFL2V_14750 [Pseudomonadota bacterium]
MSVIGYTQLMKDVLDLDKESVELQLEKLASHKLTGLRLQALRQLAKESRGTVCSVLKKIVPNHTGGTYKTIMAFFQALEHDNIVARDKVGNRSYWKFSENAKDLENYFKSS